MTDWRWVPTHLNPADDATRAVYPVRYAAVNRWIDGPDFLRTHQDLWPKEVPATTPCEEGTERGTPCSVHLVCTVPQTPVVRVTRFGDLYRLIRSMAYVLRFAKCGREGRSATATRERTICRTVEGVPQPTAAELDAAEQHLVRAVQREANAEEFAALQRGESVSKSSALVKLLPFLDGDGIMRVNGRIDRAEFLPRNVRQPMILPKDHLFTDVVAMWYHRKMRHQQLAAVIGEMRTKYWVPHMRTLVKRIKSSCMLCRLRSAQPVEPVLGQLPVDRLTPYVRAFTSTGVIISGRLQSRWDGVASSGTWPYSHA